MKESKKTYPFIFCNFYSTDGTGAEVTIDAREIEGYAYYNNSKDGKPDSMQVWLKSGRELTLSADVNQEIYLGDNLATVIDVVQYTHFGSDVEEPAEAE